MSKTRGRPFPKGNTLGGRPKGSKNKKKSGVNGIFDEYAPHVTRKCIELALKGDRSAMRICMDRISPAPRDASVEFSLPSVRTNRDVSRAFEKVARAVRTGRITPAEGEQISRILDSHSRAIERSEMEERIERLEQTVNDESSTDIFEAGARTPEKTETAIRVDKLEEEADREDRRNQESGSPASPITAEGR